MLNDAQTAQLLEISLAGSRMGQVLPARDICAAILAVKPHFVPAHIALAFSHIVVDEFDQARTLLHSVLQDLPEDKDALIMLGLAERLAGNLPEARQALTSVCPEHAESNAPQAQVAKALLAHMQ